MSLLERYIIARWCYAIGEDYIDDIEYRCIEEKFSFDHILFFRECGVTSYQTEMVKKDKRSILCDDYIQTWQLIHDAETMTTTLKRVNVRKEL